MTDERAEKNKEIDGLNDAYIFQSERAEKAENEVERLRNDIEFSKDPYIKELKAEVERLTRTFGDFKAVLTNWGEGKRKNDELKRIIMEAQRCAAPPAGHFSCPYCPIEGITTEDDYKKHLATHEKPAARYDKKGSCSVAAFPSLKKPATPAPGHEFCGQIVSGFPVKPSCECQKPAAPAKKGDKKQ